MKTLVIAPHPDDEIIGCGGTILRRVAEGGEVAWLIVTTLTEGGGWSKEQIEAREAEIARVGAMVAFARVYNLRLPTTLLDTLPMATVVREFSAVFTEFQPQEVLVPNRSDVHTDHRIVFDAAAACSKWFRYPSVRRVMAYETLSETEFGLDPAASFQPNCFVDISGYLERKLDIMAVYRSELGDFPFPRSVESIRAQATLRGAAAGFAAAEAFHLLRELQ